MNNKEDDLYIDTFAQEKPNLNYFFFLFVLVAMLSIHALHISLIEKEFTFSKYFFLFNSFAQSIVESILAFSLYVWVVSFSSKKIKKAFIALCFIFILARCIDVLLIRLIDLSIWHAFEFISNESPANFIELLRATNIPLTTWFLILFGICALVGCGLAIYKVFSFLSKKWPIGFSPRITLSVLGSSFVFLFFWNLLLFGVTSENLSSQYLKALPWKNIFFSPAKEVLLVDGCLKDPWKDKNCFAGLDSRAFALQRKPDIFLFVTESLREDFINEDIAPNLSNFRNESISFPLALSNSNATHFSWFSIFYSLYPFYFPNYQVKNWEKGSIPLTLLKKMGYEIHLHSASRLSLYSMDKVIFGKDMKLVDKVNLYGQDDKIPPHLADKRAIDGLISEISNSERSGGRLFLVFLDSTHFGYSWPEDRAIKFSPIDNQINYVQAAISEKNLVKIKNRYKNSLNYVDGLFGEFLDKLKQTSSWKESVVVFTGDHGEEFYEHGHLFHATDLSNQQIHVPLYYKIGDGTVHEKAISDQITCHMDIFPSVMHYLTGEDYFSEVLQGQSIFNTKRKSFVVGARYNAGKAPYEFYIHNGSQKMIAQFENKNDVFHSRALQIISTENNFEENIPYSFSIIHNFFGEALNSLFSP